MKRTHLRSMLAMATRVPVVRPRSERDITTGEFPALVSRCADGAPLEYDETLKPARHRRWPFVVLLLVVVAVGGAWLLLK